MKVILIAGVDTDVGKTIFTSSLVASCLKSDPSTSIGLLKLVQTGTGDREFYQELFKNQSNGVEVVTPLQFTAPIAPPLAAAKEGKQVDLKVIQQCFTNLVDSKDLVIVEGIGGLGTPITEELTVADLARSWQLETILVVPVQLGAIAQTVANVMFARYAQVNLRGIVLNCLTPTAQQNLDDWAPVNLLESLTKLPIVAIFPYLQLSSHLEDFAEAITPEVLQIILA